MVRKNPARKVASVHIWFNKEWNEDKDKPNWHLLLILEDGSIEHRLIHRLSGVCASTGQYVLNPKSGTMTMSVSMNDCFVTIDHTEACIETNVGEHEERSPKRDDGLVLLRLNTDCLKPDCGHLPKWRVVTDIQEDGTYTEQRVMDYKSTGPFIGVRHDFPSPIGPKMNIGFRGKVEIDKDVAYIMA
jgi:hypothetical protein